MSQQEKRSKPLGEEKTRAGKGKRGRKRKGMCLEDRPILEVNAAGIDIGAREIFVAVPPDRDEHPVRVFSTFTEDLEKMAQWLASCGITTVAMESTGVYWIPLYDVVEKHGVKACLVDARSMKNVPGRRTDWHECQWLQFLHSVGLLRAAFRPEGDVCAVRSMMRHRTELVEMTNQHIQHMHKALTQMNVQIQHVISDLTGLTGLAIVDAIIAGQRDPAALAKLRDPHIKASEETIRKSLVGNWRAEHLFTLQQSRESYQHYQAQIVSWLALCPDNDISGGRVLWRGMRRVHNRAGDLFRMTAYSLHHDQTPLGDYLRRMKSKLGPAGATTATAHKIAIIFYTMVNKQIEYDATLWAQRDAQREKRFEAKLKRQAQQLGYKLVPIEEKPAA